MSTLLRGLGGWVLYSTLALESASAQAPVEPRSSEAKRLFMEARACMEAGDYACAFPLLEQSQELVPASATLLNLGYCHEQLGHQVLAWRTFKATHELSLAEENLLRAQAALSRMEQLAPRLHFISVIPPEKVPEALVVSLDDERVPPAHFRTPIAVDPGTHVLRAIAPGFREHRTLIPEGTQGEPTAYHVPELVRSTAPSTDAATPPALDGQELAAIASGAVGVAGVVVGTVFGLRSLNKHHESDELCGGPPCEDPRGITSMAEARRAGNIATGAFIVGGVGLAAGAVLYFVRPFGEDNKNAVQISVGPGTLDVRGRF